ncbi:uncharacterized protein LOC119686119 [Teleopsis dalmanni]|uniref:uncharacterized protein LOC119686119 n=1 Tax=Teleopsis dalmanni TaxID=139649 RepID=UPI0018CD488B|nr:uncharacterized protein LOC119686119 [Teleopsis dalmanni]
MSNIVTTNTSLIPGTLTVKEENPLKNINNLTDLELRDTKSRLEKLLESKIRLSKLPDKGNRVQTTYKRVLSELKRREEVQEAATMFSKLNIAKIGKAALSNLEWNGNISELQNNTFQVVLDSDDEEEIDPLRLLAQKKMHRITKVLPPEPSLITEEDIQEIKKTQHTSRHDENAKSNVNNNEYNNVLIYNQIKEENLQSKIEIDHVEESASADSSNLEWIDEHVKYIVNKENQIVQQREKFKPYKTTVSNVHDPEKERIRKKHQHWEVTAATPPLIQHKAAQKLTLTDSCELQIQIMKRIKESQEKYAQERLAAKLERLQNMKINIPDAEELKKMSSFTTYRTANNVIEGNLVLSDHELNEND